MRRLAPAKVNLSLHVLGRRSDGYHDLASVMQQISLCDELHFSLCPDGISLSCPGADLPAGEDNLVWRAATALFHYAGFRGGAKITLHKNIPTAAGLGGGSSDAAATLMALNDLCSLNVSQSELMQIGAKLGADIPFFIFGPSAFATGIGDKLQALEGIPPLNIVLINPAFPLATGAVYSALNLTLTKKKNNYSIPRFYALGDVIQELHNDLESVSLRMHPELNDFKQMLKNEGALGALMSGSGPTLFGIFEDEKSAQDARDAILKKVSGDCLVFFAQSL
ncbi:MAG: 4-(cytidine 5'-diphospho)-2-C-methyl-D-erythritol kinase [Smithellaceae bacterium]|nr:4-(cytidine 5'-diphospho)-2-C-methyl-D-erythritol kinase [Smithellaceae bacterium]NLX51531.1 4-(cytidine 5'-diphospho)-2-C-methyl-D-erythritol kinase [Deltaproteobacteria bacterium]